ncbi:MAG: bifunctional adenosylcobinamide kinase/adenosylcobinamide-phosphate guanylyltransferase [Pseudomonadales bacterium]
MKQLILGGARSGKSSLAEQLAQSSEKTVIYIATADITNNDCEMDRRIQHHQQRRPNHWQTIESPLHLAQAVQQQAAEDRCLLVDCLTLWLTNCLCHDDNNLWPQQRQALLDVIVEVPGDIILVGNEIGSGIVPMGEINRRFVDESGFLHQSLAVVCGRVILTAAGLPLVLKGRALRGEKFNSKASQGEPL